MDNQYCYLCGSDQNISRLGSVRDNSEIKPLECIDCGLVFLSSQAHIQQNHYAESGMHNGEMPDIKSWLKETAFDDERRFQFMKDQITNKTLLDFGCGTAGFLERAKLLAIEVSGIELEKALQTSFQERELNVFSNLQLAQEDRRKWDVITAFHIVEHLSDPRKTLSNLSTLLNKEGQMIIEVPSANDVLLTLYNNQPFQNFTYWSQHLYFFNSQTLSDLIKQSGLKLNWLKHIQRYPLSNHLYWLANGKPGGHQKWGFLNDNQLNKAYESQLASIGKTDTLIAGVSR
jgi:2-polyprenyl-3-methyl-5-hydroxy-6-metoxy-1,4-benzoquinol methylase